MGVWPDRTYKFPWNLDPLTIFGWSCKEGKTSAKRNWQQITHILDNEVWLVSKPVKVVLKKYIPPIYISISNSQVCADTLIKDVYICHFVELCHHSQKQRKKQKMKTHSVHAETREIRSIHCPTQSIFLHKTFKKTIMFFHSHHQTTKSIATSTSWWFQPIWKILVKLETFPK